MRVRGLVALTVVVAAAALVLVGLHRLTRSPDVAGEARSAPVRAAGEAAARMIDERLAAVVAAAPGGTELGASMQDRCHRDGGLTSVRSYVACSRVVRRYLALDGDRAARQRAWAAALRAAGWTVDGGWTDGGAYTSAGHGTVRVRMEWTERPAPPPVYRDLDRGKRLPDYDGQVTLAQEPVDLVTMYRQAYARHRHVVAIAMEEHYHPARRGSAG